MKNKFEKFNVLSDLIRLFAANPLDGLKNLRPANIRRLRSALERHDRATVLAIVRNRLMRESSLVEVRKIKESDSAGKRKAKELEAKYPGITEPVGLSSIYLIEEKLGVPKYAIDKDAPARVNVLIPQLDPLIMFGGYIACLHFIRRVQANGFQVRILLCESGPFDRHAVELKLAGNPALRQAIVECEVENITSSDAKPIISLADSFVCYSYWTGIKAHHLAQSIGKEFIFFLQEYEAIFHPHDTCYAIASYVYRLPQRAIFNTSILADYFRSRNLSVYGRYQGNELEQHSVVFQHALTPTKTPSLEEIAQRKTKRLLFYGRPEGHARRNLFELALIGLKIAIFRGVFDEDWEFYGVGTLGDEYDIELGLGHTMKLSGTLPQSDYGEALSEYDLGLSLMMAPHPSILPFEMASAGQIVVTNAYESRTAEVLQSISSNIEPCEPDPYSVAESLVKAVKRVSQFEDRINGADFDWVRDWDQAFNDDVMEQITRMLRS